MAKMWMVRAGDKGQIFSDFKNKNIVAIGWSKLKDLSEINSLSELKIELKQLYPEAKKGSISMWAGEINKFKNEFKKGDKVATYNSERRVYLIGEIIGDYIYSRNEEYPNIRNVKWLGEVYRDYLSKPAKNSMGSIATLFEVNKSVEQEVFSLLEGHPVVLSEESMNHTRSRQEDLVVPVNVKELLNKINLEEIKNQKFHFLKNPGIRIISILENVEKRWVLPNFQRYYDWDKEDVRAFLESIFNDYFVGSLLLWEIENDVPIATFPIFGVKNKIDKKEAIILDGKQRITSLYYAIKAPEYEEDKVNAFFYINFKNFFEGNSEDRVIASNKKYDLNDSVKMMLFPLWKLEKSDDWIRAFEDYYENQDLDKHKFREMVRLMEDRIKHFYDGFQIPEIRLPSTMKLHHVVDIFENLNTKGKPLDAFDLLIAASSKHNVDLRELWDKSVTEYPSFKNYSKRGNKIRMYIIQAISLLYNESKSCKRSDILEIYEQVYNKNKGKNPEMFKEHWKEMSKYVNEAIEQIENLNDGFGVINEDYIPFLSIIPILAALLKETKLRENKYKYYEKIKQWYWSVIFSNAYSSSVDSQLTSDFKEMLEWFGDDSKIPSNVKKARNNLRILDLEEVSSFSNSVYKGILSILALEGARDLRSGKAVSNKKEYHEDHIFPKSKFKDYGVTSSLINSILNITYLPPETNLDKLDEDPSKYFKNFKEEFKGSNEDYLEVLKSHLITGRGYEALLEDSFSNFINERKKLFLDKIASLIGAEKQVLNEEKEASSFNELLNKNESKNIEFKSSIRVDMRTNQINKELEKEVLKTIVAFMNSNGGTLLIGVSDNKEILGIQKDIETLKKKDDDGFQQLIISLFNSHIGATNSENLSISFEEVQGKKVAVVKIKPSNKGVFLDSDEFYIRSGNTSKKLNNKETQEYIRQHF